MFKPDSLHRGLAEIAEHIILRVGQHHLAPSGSNPAQRMRDEGLSVSPVKQRELK